MDARLVSKYKSYTDIETVLDDNRDAVASVRILGEYATEYGRKLQVIKDTSVPEPSATKPVTQDKIELFEAVAANVDQERLAIRVYARANNLPVLLGKMPVSVSALNEGSEVERLFRYKDIHKEATTLGNALDGYGLEPGVIADLTARLPLLDDKLNHTQTAIDNRVLAGEDLVSLYRDMDAFIKNYLTPAVLTRQRAFPGFVAEYKKAKKLPPVPVRHRLTDEQKAARNANKAANKAAKESGKTPTEAVQSTQVVAPAETNARHPLESAGNGILHNNGSMPAAGF